MVLTKYTGIQTLTGSEAEIFNVNKGPTTIHFGSSVYLDELVSGDTVRVRVYDKKDGVGFWKFDGEVNDYVGTNNGTITYNTNLKRLYKFEQNLNDSTGTANGTLAAGTATYSSGSEGSSFSFNGSTNITASDTGMPSGNSAFSVSLWINPTGVSTQQLLTRWGTESSGQAMIVAIDETSPGTIDVDIFGGSILHSATLVQQGVWSHVVVTSDGTTTKIYINGVLDANSVNHTWAIVLNGIRLSGYAGGSQYSGLMDETRFYNIALSQAQVSALYMVGKYGQSHTFDGGEYISITPTGIPTGNSDRTISFWIKTPSTFTANDFIFSYGAGTTNNMFGALWTSTSSSSTLTMVGFANDINSNTVFQPNTWYHVVIVLSSNGTIRTLYVNGVQDIQSTTTALNTSSSTFYFGTRVDNVGVNALHGQLDEFRIYSRVLSSSEVSDLYNNPQNLNSIVYDKSYSGAQSSKTLYIPIIQTNNYSVTLQQTAGNYYKTLNWSRIEII